MKTFGRQAVCLCSSVLLALAIAAFAADRKLEDGLYAEMETSKGTIVLKLEFEKTPLTVANFVGLAEGTKYYSTDGGQPKKQDKPFYNGLTFHIVLPDFIIQGGNPQGTGARGPGYRFKEEFDPSLKHDKPGILSMVNEGPRTSGSQFFITRKDTPWLDNRCSVFGHVVEGQDVVNKIVRGDTIKTVKILRVGEKAKGLKGDEEQFQKLSPAEQDSLNNSTISNLVAGLLVENSDSYVMNLGRVNKTLRTVGPSESEPLSQALLARWEVLQDKPYIENLFTATTNRFLEEMARNIYKARRQQGYSRDIPRQQEQVNHCEKAMAIISSLAAYGRADDLRVFLEDIRAKPNGFNFHVDFVAWQACGFSNGPYGALVNSVLQNGTEEHLRSLLDILGAERSPRREIMLNRFRLKSGSSPEIRGKLTALVNEPEFKEIREEVLKAVSEIPARSEGK